MDQSRFDDLSRRLAAATTRRAGIRAALGAMIAASAAGLDSEARRRDGRGKDAESGRKKRKKLCKPACGPGYECVKGTCTCPTAVTCGDACCRVGQICDGGACVAEPEPVRCVPAGEPCKGLGRACCDGRVCASGQGGMADIACYAPKTGACTTTADCVYGMGCRNGRCAPPEPVAGLGTPCSSASQQGCTTPGAVCTAYTGPGAPGGSFCTLPEGAVCTGDPQCTCYKCFYPNGGGGGSARATGSADRLACCGPAGYACQSDRNCCLGSTCVNGQCSSCQPSFPVTSDPVQNGIALQKAIDAMKPGDILLLAPGIYDAPMVPEDWLQGSFFVFSPARGHQHEATYTIARCGSGDVVLRDGGDGLQFKALQIKGALYPFTPDTRFTVVLRDITVSSKSDPAADPSKCSSFSTASANKLLGGGVEIRRGELVLEGGSRIVNTCNQKGGLDITYYDSTAVLKDDVVITRNVGYGVESGGVLIDYDRASLIMQDNATITGNYSMGSGICAGGVVLSSTNGSATGVTAQNVYGNFAPNQALSTQYFPPEFQPCQNYLNNEFPQCYLP